MPAVQDAEPSLRTLAEVKALLEREQAEREELSYEQNLALDHASHFVALSPTEARKLVEELLGLGGRVTPYYAHLIADVLPADENDVKALFARDRSVPDDAAIAQILETVSKYA